MQKIIIGLFTIGVLVTQGNSNSPQVYNDIVVGEEYTVENYTLKGKTEECTLVFRINSKELLVTNCLELTNSKKIRIFCTPKKKLCKTENEILYIVHRTQTQKQIESLEMAQNQTSDFGQGETPQTSSTTTENNIWVNKKMF